MSATEELAKLVAKEQAKQRPRLVVTLYDEDAERVLRLRILLNKSKIVDVIREALKLLEEHVEEKKNNP
mgnify:FL=1